VDLCVLSEHAGVSLRVRFSHEGRESIGAFVDKATLCALGLILLFCLVTVAAGVFLALLIRQSLKS